MTNQTEQSDPPSYEFFSRLARILNSGQSRSVLLCGNVHDLYRSSSTDAGYVPLIQYLGERCNLPGIVLLVYELNGPIRVLNHDHTEKLKRAWTAWKTGEDFDNLVLKSLADTRRKKERDLVESEFDRHVRQAIGRPTTALEFLRQLAQCSRSKSPNGNPYLTENLLIIVEAADMLVPAGSDSVTRLSFADRHRVTILQDWFSDPGFMNGDDSVVLLAESRTLVHPRVARLPSVMSVEVAAPTFSERLHYIRSVISNAEAASDENLKPGGSDHRWPAAPKLWSDHASLASLTAGLSIHALRQLLLAAAHRGETIQPPAVLERVQDHLTSQLGEDVIEFKKPSHSLEDVVGFRRLKTFINKELLPRFRADGAAALPGAAVAGPIGSGKTFIFEAAAAALDLPVLVLKNIRSQWFGQTDVIFERLRRCTEALGKVLIFVDEADTQFGGVGPGTHDTERRLTGRIQAMMSDPKLRGKVIWLLMTARIHLLSPDIRRPGRVGDLIIPVLDPEGDDHADFVRWAVCSSLSAEPDKPTFTRLVELTQGYSAAAFASLRSALKASAQINDRGLTQDEVEQIVHDMIPPEIGKTRRYQALQAMVNCTRRSLLPDPSVDDAARAAWNAEIMSLERQGIA